MCRLIFALPLLAALLAVPTATRAESGGQPISLGLVNQTDTMEGVQIGLINIIHTGGMLPVFPFFNFSFK
jgi:hypothetical protein